MNNIIILCFLFLIGCGNNKEKTNQSEVKNDATIKKQLRITTPSNNQAGKIQGFVGGCGYNYSPGSDSITIYQPRQREVDQINSILQFSGLTSNFKIYSAKIENAVATIIDDKRYIIYDPRLLGFTDNQSGNYWSSMSILAHEIGHHLAGHTLNELGSTPSTELEADKYSGFVLYKLGASLNQSTAALVTLSTEIASASHPARSNRIKAVTGGWNDANKQRFSSAIPPPPVDNVSDFHIYTYDMLISEESIREGLREESEYKNYDYYYGIIKDAKVVNHQVEIMNIYIVKTGKDGDSYGIKEGEVVTFGLDDYWQAPKTAQIPAKSLPYLLVPGRRLKFSFVEGIYGGTAESGVFLLTYIKALEGSSF